MFKGECRKEERKGVGWWVGEQWKTQSQLIAPSFHGNTRPFPPTPVSLSLLSLCLTHSLTSFTFSVQFSLFLSVSVIM